MLNSTEQALIDARPNEIDFSRLKELHYIGNYTRRLPVSLSRMMENAYDWEHLPFVHASSFSSIDLIESGPWGWRTKVGIPNTDGSYQLIDLLIDPNKHYWATTVISGPGEGVEIHTQASAVSEHEIDIDVRFYLPFVPPEEAVSLAVLTTLQDQYRTLYDEDLALMSGRQSALDDNARWKKNVPKSKEICIGPIAELDPEAVYIKITDHGRFCIRYWQNRWIVHSAVCTHLLGPLDESTINERGEITCPWHGYRFKIETGENIDQECKALQSPPDLIEKDGTLCLKIER